MVLKKNTPTLLFTKIIKVFTKVIKILSWKAWVQRPSGVIKSGMMHQHIYERVLFLFNDHVISKIQSSNDIFEIN
jgi:hypothetical protein